MSPTLDGDKVEEEEDYIAWMISATSGQYWVLVCPFQLMDYVLKFVAYHSWLAILRSSMDLILVRRLTGWCNKSKNLFFKRIS